MASYEENASTVIDSVTNSTGVSTATKDAINSIISEVTGGDTAQGVTVETYTPGQTVSANTVVLTVDAGTTLTGENVGGKAIIMNENSSAQVTFSADADTTAMVVGGAGNSNVVFQTAQDVAVTLQGGEGDTVVVGAGNNNITTQGGSATIQAGDGNNTVTLQGGTANLETGHGDNVIVFTGNEEGGTANIKAGDGNNSITFDAGVNGTANIQTGNGSNDITLQGVMNNASVTTGDGNDSIQLQGEGTASIKGGAGNMVLSLQNDNLAATIDAGDGFDQLTMHSARHAHSFLYDFINRVFRMHSADIQMENVNVVTFDTNDDGILDQADQATVLANDQFDSTIAKLYKIALGRDPFDNPADYQGDIGALGGIDWWMHQYDEAQGMDHMIASFLNSEEFNNLYGSMDNTAFVERMFDNLNAEAVASDGTVAAATTVAGRDAAAWVDAMNQGMSKVDVATAFVESAEAVQILGVDGAQYVIDGFGA